MENSYYSMAIEWDDRDDIFVVTIPELPGCRTHGKTYEEAVQHGKEAIADLFGGPEWLEKRVVQEDISFFFLAAQCGKTGQARKPKSPEEP